MRRRSGSPIASVAILAATLALGGCQQDTVRSDRDNSSDWNAPEPDATSDTHADSMHRDVDGGLGVDASPDTDGENAPRVRTSTIDFSHVSAGRHHTCGVTVAGKLRCWGIASDPTQQGEFLDYDQAVPPEGADWALVSAGNRMSCAITRSNTVSCWGSNRFGEANPP